MDMDDLVSQLGQSMKVDPSTLGQDHPLLAKYKNAGKLAEQQANRRIEALERQKDSRWDQYNHARKLVDCEFDSDDEVLDEEQQGLKKTDYAMDLSKKTGQRKQYKNRYAGELMLSEWLVDIPESLSEDWLMLPCPVGKRCLLMASRGVTTIYRKSGSKLHQFTSSLPGGAKSSAGVFTLLDCILVKETIYCLDIMAWASNVFYNSPFDLRRFWLKSKFEETPQLATPSSKSKFCFEVLPDCTCDLANMEKMMNNSFKYELDGLLFYHKSVIYEAGQSPLIGWLKPWMLPEILNVSVPSQYTEGKTQTSKQFITEFNEKHKHVSKIEKTMEVE